MNTADKMLLTFCFIVGCVVTYFIN